MQGPTATLGIYVDAGSVYEKPMQSGRSRLSTSSIHLSLMFNVSGKVHSRNFTLIGVHGFQDHHEQVTLQNCS